MKIVIDISKDRYDEIMSMDWNNCRLIFGEEIRAIHDGKVLEKEPCDDCVSRKAVLKIYDEWFATCNIADKKESPKRKMKALPPVAPQPKMGQWISYNWNDNGIARWGIKCDQCYKEYRYGGEMGGTYKYCPFCGCKMQEAKE